MMHLRRRQFAFWSALGTLGVLGPARALGAARAGRTRISVEVKQRQVQVGAPVRFVVKVVHEGSGQVPEPTLSSTIVENFQVRGPSVSSSFQSSFVNGRITRQSVLTHTYVLQPERPGTFRLSAHVVDDDGTRIGSNEPMLAVTGDAVESEQQQSDEAPEEARGAVFLWSKLDRHEAYVGQQITYALDVYERMRFTNIQLQTLPTFQDFWAEELPEGDKRTALVEGMAYRVHPVLRRALFPQRAGTLRIGAAEASLGFRGRVGSDPVEIEVLPLPAEGRPKQFSPNNVGRFEISAEVDQRTVKQGQPLTLTVTISGTGNLGIVDPGDWPSIGGVRRYDPKVTTEMEPSYEVVEGTPLVGGVQRYEFLLIPDEPGQITIPAHRFSFFDPTAERYQTVDTEPIPIEVVAGDGGADGDADEATNDEQQEEGLLGVRQLQSLPRDPPEPPWLTPRRWAYGMAAVPAAVLAWLGGEHLWRRLGSDEKTRARAAARRRRRTLLESARARVETGEGFHAAVAQLLQEVAVARAGSDGVGLPRPELLRLLAQQGVIEKDLATLRELLDHCDSIRFGTLSGTKAQRQQTLERAERLIRHSSLSKGAR